METQDHKRLNHSGSGEHGAVHVCNKCGWPFPNAHPSSRHRRAHKKVCGTVEGYKLDNVSQDKEASDSEHNSDDALKTASDKIIERTISRKSSSGVGSRSSRSTKSEDDNFTDAVTEFNESPATVVEEAHVSLAGQVSHDGLQRFYSMQRELDDIMPAEASPITDDVCAPTIVEDKLPTVPKLQVEKGLEDIASEDYTFTSPSLVSAVATFENENALDLNIKQSSQLSSELDIVSERDIEIMLNKNAELRASYGDTIENVVGDVSLECCANDEQKATSDELLDSVTAGGLVKPITLNGSDGVVDDYEKLSDINSPGKHEVERHNDIDSPENFHSPVLQVVASGDGNSSKTEMIEDCDYKISNIDNPHVLAVPDASVLQGHSEVAVEDVDQTGKINTCKSPDTAVASAEYIEACTVEEGGADITFGRTSDSDRVFSDNIVLQNVFSTDDNLKQEAGQKSAVEQLTSKEITNMPDPKVSVGDIKSEEVIQDLESVNVGDKNDSYKQKPPASLENVFPEGAITAHIQDTFSNGDVIASNIVKNDAEHVNTLENEGTMVSEGDSAFSASVSTKSANDEVALRAEEVNNTHQSNGMGEDENVRVEDTVLGGKELRSAGELENESTDAETGPAYGLISGDVVAGHTQGESQLTSQCVGETDSNFENEFQEECIANSGTTAVLKTDDHLDSTSKVEMIEDAEFSCQSSAAVNHISSDKFKFTESTCNPQDDRTIEQPVVMSAVDTIVDSGSQTDSLDGNWGSISVKSAASDAQPATDSHASNNSQEKGTNLELKPVLENEQSQNETSVRPEIGIEQKEYASEIQTTNEEQQINYALQTGWSPTVSHVENEAHKGKKEKEIIAKVTNWDSGKQHTPLKTLLGEATAKSREESPLHHSQSSTFVPQTDDIPVTNNGFSAKSENVIPSSSKPEMEAGQEEMGKEWNSPARYPVNIKSEKRKGKGKPLWAPFLCCSSVNAR